MLNTKYKRLCLVKIKKGRKLTGLSENRCYKVIQEENNSLLIYNDKGFYMWYNKKCFERNDC